MVAAHFSSIEKCMKAVKPLMQHKLFTCEMMDKIILDCTKDNISQAQNRDFVSGDPAAVLMLELRSDSNQDLQEQIEKIVYELDSSNLSYAHPILYGDEINKAFELRKAGLGLLGNIVGDNKAVACIEDTAVTLDDLADYIEEFSELMKAYKQQAVYYAHAGAGEIHLRPILNLKKSKDVQLFKEITTKVAHLVKKYNGSMSGEHGDGIVRSSFIPLMIGQDNFEILKGIKQVFDPTNIFNPGKIINPYPIDKKLRYVPNRLEPEFKTKLDFNDSEGILKLSEKCNGSGDCRKSVEAGGGMCPSYRATKNEKDTTRARANALREVLTNSTSSNVFNSKVLDEAFKLCVSCKACASECPSNVDVAALKTEYLYQKRKNTKFNLRDLIFGYNHKINQLAIKLPIISNFIFSNKLTSNLFKKSLGIAQERDLPIINKTKFSKWLKRFLKNNIIHQPIKQVYLFVDEFINYNDFELGKATVELLTKLNYQICFTDHAVSARTLLSKGYLDQAKEIIDNNITIFSEVINQDIPLIGIEPSGILSFKDEYLRLATDKKLAKNIASNTLIIDEFLSKEVEIGNIKENQFTQDEKEIKLHVHCHQKVLSNQFHSFNILNLPKNYKVSIINSGCCGMAGSFGYEKENYEVSMQMGGLSLFPKILNSKEETIISATGFSCREQIKNGTNRLAIHPVQILNKALI